MKRLLSVIVMLCLVGCSETVPDQQDNLVGYWSNNQTALLITKAGRIEYESQKGSASTSLSLPIQSISDTELVAGILFFNTSFTLSGPTLVDGYTVLTVDGEALYKIGDDGRATFSVELPKLEALRLLVGNSLTMLSDAIEQQNFSHYLESASMQFQSKFNNEQLIAVYQPFIEQNINIKEWLVGDFVLTGEPRIADNGVLTLIGQYPTSPDSLKFKLTYVYADGKWKELGADVAINNQ